MSKTQAQKSALVLAEGSTTAKAKQNVEAKLQALGYPMSVPEPHFTKDSVNAVARAHALQASATKLARSMDERGAMLDLVRARAILTTLAHLPGSAHLLADAETDIGLLAFSVGQHALADSSLRRAFALDPERRVGAAEAPPAARQHAEAIKQTVTTGPQGEFQITVHTPSNTKATVWVDDRIQQSANIKVPVGPHVIRISAPGCLPFGTVFDVFEGRRPTFEITLTPTEQFVARQHLQIHGCEVASCTQASVAELSVWRIIDDEWLMRCGAEGCTRPVQLGDVELSVLQHAPFAPPSTIKDQLSPERVVVPPKELKRRINPAVWVALGVVVVGAAVALGVGLAGREPQNLTTRIDFGDLAP